VRGPTRNGRRREVLPGQAQAARSCSIQRLAEHRERKGQDLCSSETWRPDRPTLVFVSGVAYALSLFEIAHAIECKYVGGK